MQRRIFFLDHKIQLLKIAHPKIVACIFVRCPNDKVSVVRGVFERDILNSDFNIVNDVEELIIKIRDSMEN